MFCTACRNELSDRQQFCPVCGVRSFSDVTPLQPSGIFLGGDITEPGRELHGRFVSLGDMTGMTLDEIIAAVGPPSSRSSMGSGRTLLQWQATGCHAALLFGPDGRFIEITHQYAQYFPAPAVNIGNIVIGVIVGIAAIIVVVLLIAVIYRW